MAAGAGLRVIIALHAIDSAARREREAPSGALYSDGSPRPSGSACDGADSVLRISLSAPGPGTYTVSIDRIGFTRTSGGPFALSKNQVLDQEIRIGSIPQLLPGVDARSDNTCGFQTASGGTAAALWEEIRKALTANLITLTEAQPWLHVRQFVRETTFGGRVLREWVESADARRGLPFVAMAPQELAEKGFVYPIGDSTMFAAPDARLLLSDEFIATHCFRPLPVNRTDRLRGLEFQPVPNRALPDVRGAIWIDGTSSELRHLEYGYTGLPGLVQSLGPGGRLEFTRLASGEWIVSQWFIRMVRFERDSPSQDPKLMGYRFRGGRAEPAREGENLMTHAIIRGTVTDSTISAPLPGVMVRVQGTSDSTTSDGSGQYRIETLASGPRILEAIHPKMGLLKAAQRDILVSIGDSTSADFAVPPLAAFVQVICRNSRLSGVFGLAWRRDGGLADSAAIEASWGDGKESRVLRTRTDQRGFFGVCGLPFNQRIVLRLMEGGLPAAEQNLVPQPSKSLWVDLRPFSLIPF